MGTSDQVVLVLCPCITPTDGGPCVMSALPTSLLSPIIDHVWCAVGIHARLHVTWVCFCLQPPLQFLLFSSSSPAPLPPSCYAEPLHPSISNPEHFSLQFLLSGMPFAQLTLPHSIGLTSPMPFSARFPFTSQIGSPSAAQVYRSFVIIPIFISVPSVLFTSVAQSAALCRQYCLMGSIALNLLIDNAELGGVETAPYYPRWH